MEAIGASSSAPPNHSDPKPVVVRVKRKASQSPLDAFWLEINERPLKRALLDFEKLSLSKSSTKEELTTTKVFVQHVKTVSSAEATVDIVQSFVEPNLAEVSGSKAKSEDRRHNFKKENENIHGQILSKTRQKQEVVAKNARFEQIWRSRKGNIETVQGKLQDICQFYDVVRVDVEDRGNEMKHMKETLEDHRILCNYLPLLREFIPSAAEEIESDLLAYKVGKDDYVYDLYTVKDEVEETAINASSQPFPLVQVDEEDFCDGPDDSDYGSDDSNAENNPLNEYPDEEISEDEEESTDSDNKSEEESDGDKSLASEDLGPVGRSEGVDFFVEDNDDDDDDDGSVYEHNDEDDGYCQK